jgi:hypothetical protein
MVDAGVEAAGGAEPTQSAPTIVPLATVRTDWTSASTGATVTPRRAFARMELQRRVVRNTEMQQRVGGGVPTASGPP